MISMNNINTAEKDLFFCVETDTILVQGMSLDTMKTPVLLHVEDNPDHATLVERGLEEGNITNELVHLTDGELALDYLLRRKTYCDESTSPRPDLVLLDLRLPRVDGLDVLKEIKSNDQLKEIPTIILTTSSAESDVAMAYKYHANSYLVKPSDFDAFTNLMESLGRYWLSYNFFRRPGDQHATNKDQQEPT